MPKGNAALIRELHTIRKSFRQLARSFSKIAPALTRPLTDAPASETVRRKPRLTAKQRAALKL